VLLIRLLSNIYRAFILRSLTISKTLVLEKSCNLFISEDTKEFCPPYESQISVDNFVWISPNTSEFVKFESGIFFHMLSNGH
jgi:hypothetical protein